MVKKVSTEQYKGRARKNTLRIIVPLFIILLLTTGYLLYSEVASVHNIFSPSITGVSRVDVNDSWTPVRFEDNENLEISGIFWNKEVVNDANSTDETEIRIINEQTGEVIYEFILEAGKSNSLSNLKTSQDYLVEVKGNTGEYFLNFY